ncbi:MAG: FAD-dependent oxidoreductase [Chthoniobacter sp.]
MTFALSASHTAFSSIRMEPVFMVTSQSAATAACLALDGHTSVAESELPPITNPPPGRRASADRALISYRK